MVGHSQHLHGCRQLFWPADDAAVTEKHLSPPAEQWQAAERCHRDTSVASFMAFFWINEGEITPAGRSRVVGGSSQQYQRTRRLRKRWGHTYTAIIYCRSTETGSGIACLMWAHKHTAYLRNSCRQVSQNRCPQVDTWTGSRIALLQSGHWKRRFGFSKNL